MTSFADNPILSTDSYKFSHFAQYPAGTTYIQSHIAARGTQIPGVREVVMFGLQSYIKNRLLKPITRRQVEEAADFCKKHGTPFNRDGWLRIVDEHDGFLPIAIFAVPEGTPVALGNMMVKVQNTVEGFGWLVSYVETDILRAVWYGSTVATISRECKRVIKEYLDLSSDAPDAEINFKLHDFGFRGVSSYESAGIGGAAHLINFFGTDTVAGIAHAMDYYDADVCGFSISASEHSTMTLRGRENEKQSYQAMIDAYASAPGALFAVVSDSYDLFNAIENIWVKGGLLEQVKKVGATVVIRPDSGNPVTTPCDAIAMLWDLLPEKLVNDKGYKILPPYVRVIQGDGITIESIRDILTTLVHKRGFSATNIAFGMGGGLLQHATRDTFKFAMKANAAIIDGREVDVYKDPVTDPGKRSMRGKLELFKVTTPDGRFIGHATLNSHEVAVLKSDTWIPEYTDKNGNKFTPAMRCVYSGGRTHNTINFEQVRKNAALV